MKTTPPPRHHHAHAAGRLLGAMFGVWLLGAVYTPAVAAISAVTVDQQPLTLQPPIPPNVMLMLDDSGSMAWDYMPDACYLNGVTCTGTNNGTTPTGNGTDRVTAVVNNAMIDASNNGVYYNPTVTYSPPPTANGGTYQSYSDITNVPQNGFNASSTKKNLTTYSSSDVRGEAYNQSYQINYSTNNQQNVTATFNQTVTSQGSGYWATYADAVCQNDFNQYNGNGSGPQFTGKTQNNQGNWLTGTCIFTYTNAVTYYYFQYATGPAAGSYTVYYVAPASQGCGTQSNCVLDTDTSGAAAPSGIAAGQNIANWFAYYHTRIQMAKSGLMTAFSTVRKTFRVGFGSIDGGANGDANNMPASASSVYTYNDTYNGVTNTVANVQPFGDGSVSTDQKNRFWTWAAALSPSGGTPLRAALDAIGQYYETSQPWTTMSSDPSSVSSNTYIACRQSYTILTTDGFWNGNYTSTTTSSASDTSGPTVSGPNGQSYTYAAAAPYSGGDTADGSPSLADVAMYYWKTDLQAAGNNNIANEVPTSTEDPAFWQHMTTFTMGLGFTPTGISGTSTSNGTPPVTDTPPTISDIFSAANGNGTLTGFSWPTPASNSIYNISDLAHAGVNGHGGFYSATSPQTFAGGLSDALKRASERVGTGASLAANSTQLTNGTVAYQANYYTSKWKGDLKALAINSSTGVIATTPSWSAAAMVTSSSAGSRNIVTYVPPASSSGTGTFVAFQDSASNTPPVLSTAELNALGSTAAAQATMVNYLRGDNSQEQKNKGGFRNRDTPLGDIVDSQPVYSGAPNPNEFEGQTFTGITATTSAGTIPDNSFQTWAVGYTDSSGTFHTSTASQRAPLVFVAANDGMLHAFDAGTGAEKYAYLPGAVITAGLANLANTAYGSDTVPHQYYNDGELTIADAFFNSAWHTVLVGTTGRGPAEAVYALDITDPSNITPLWERSAGDGQTNSNYIGQMVGKPVIAKVQDGTANSDWQVLIGNGYNSASGTAALLEFNLATGALSVHSATSRISTAGNGLAAAVAWMDDASTGTSTEAYAGDLQGQVWSFPLGNTVTKAGTTSYVPDPNPLGGVSTTGTLVFSTPLDASGNPQPITAGMLAGRDPTTGNVWLFFGTGQYLSSNDLANKQVESWYGVIAQSGSPSATTSNATVNNLVQRYITYEQAGSPNATPPTLGVRTVTTPTDTGYAAIGSKLGWYMNLQQPTLDSNGNVTGYNAQGERMVTPNQFQGNLLLATTRIPVVTDICNPSGSGWVMAVNPFTGTNPSGNFFAGNGGGTVTLPSGKVVPAAGVGFSSLPNNPIFVGGDMLMSFDNGTTSSLMTTGSTGALTRVSWQELVNP